MCIRDRDDRVVPVTVIQAEPNTICQVKTKDSDGYEAVQLGFGAIKEKDVYKRQVAFHGVADGAVGLGREGEVARCDGGCGFGFA